MLTTGQAELNNLSPGQSIAVQQRTGETGIGVAQRLNLGPPTAAPDQGKFGPLRSQRLTRNGELVWRRQARCR